MASIFLREFNLANGDFCVCLFCGTNFCDWENCLFSLGINFCDFPEAAFYLELQHSRFLSINNRMQVNTMQMYNTLNQLINGIRSDDPFLLQLIHVTRARKL